MMTAEVQAPSEAEIVSRHKERMPVDVDALARDLGVNVVHAHDLGSQVAGKIQRDARLGGPSGFAVYVNANDPPRRQRFTLAHELGHYILHRDLMDGGIVDDTMYRSPLGDWYERQANRFAADVLLPEQLVRSEYRRGNKALNVLAKRFDVSPDAMRIRLKELNLGA